MPGFLTHYIAGQAMLKLADSKLQKKILPFERLYNLGTQGPDIFFYYLPGHLRKRTRGLGVHMHLNDLGIFLAEMARLAKASPPRERDIVLAYISGFVMHYTLDANTHPYVYAMTHHENVSKIKNSADHRKLETAIDIAMLKLVSGKKPADYNQWELIAADNGHMYTASCAFSYVLNQVYQRQIPANIIHRAMRHMVHATRILQSRKGKKKRWMELMENISIKQPYLSSMIHDQELPPENDCLNTKKSSWQAPWENEITHHESFLDCYQTAIDEGLSIIKSLHAYIYETIEIETLATKLGNRSLKTGLPLAGGGIVGMP
ncbi:MAG: zinc dependent phospholipase C family protein [Defluviitaleaceae bacterium]|nr:zinc dependent phospholipase C family protein [Defluviitaleaceae bacterium]